MSFFRGEGQGGSGSGDGAAQEPGGDKGFSEAAVLSRLLHPPAPHLLLLLLPLCRASLPTLPVASRVIKNTLNIVRVIALAILSSGTGGLDGGVQAAAAGEEEEGVRVLLPAMWGLVQCTPESLDGLEDDAEGGGEGPFESGRGDSEREPGCADVCVGMRLGRAPLARLMDDVYHTLSACENLKHYLPLPPLGVLLDRPFNAPPSLPTASPLSIPTSSHTPSRPSLLLVPEPTFRAAEQLERRRYTRQRLAGLGGLAGRISGHVSGGDGGEERGEGEGDGDDDKLNLGQALVVGACSRLGRALSSPASHPHSVEEAEVDQAVDAIASRPSPWARLGEDLRLCLSAPCMEGVTGSFVGATLLRAMVFYCSDVEFCAAIDAVYAASSGSSGSSPGPGDACQDESGGTNIGTVLIALGVQPALIEAVVLHESRQVFNACSSTVHDADSLMGAQGMLNQLPCRPPSVSGENALYDLCLLLAQMGVDCVPLRVRLQHPIDTCDAILTAQPLLSASLDGYREGEEFDRPLGVRLTRLLVALPWTDRSREVRVAGGSEYAPLASELRVMFLLHAMRGADSQQAAGSHQDWDWDADPGLRALDGRAEREGVGVGAVSLLAKQVAALFGAPDAACSPSLQAALARLLPAASFDVDADDAGRVRQAKGLHDAALRAVEAALARFPSIARAQGQAADGEGCELSRILVESAPPDSLLTLLPLLLPGASSVGISGAAGGSHHCPMVDPGGEGGGGVRGGMGGWQSDIERGPWSAVAAPLLRFLLPLLYAPHDRLVAHLWRAVRDGQSPFETQLCLPASSESETLIAACLSARRSAQPSLDGEDVTALPGLLTAALAELRSLHALHTRRGLVAGASADPVGSFSTGIDEVLVAQLMHKVSFGIEEVSNPLLLFSPHVVVVVVESSLALHLMSLSRPSHLP